MPKSVVLPTSAALLAFNVATMTVPRSDNPRALNVPKVTPVG